MAETPTGLTWVSCPLCGYDDAAPYLTGRNWGDGVFQIVRCRHCGLLYTNPRPDSNHLGTFYPQNYYSYRPHSEKRSRLKRALLRCGAHLWLGYPTDSSGAPLLARWIISLLTCLVKRQLLRLPPWKGGGTVLDVGCGWGEYLLLMRELGWNTIGVDLAEQAVTYARGQLGLDVRQGTVESQHFADGTFDVVTLWDVLEHLEEPGSTLTEIRRILKPGGLLLMKVPDCSSLQARWLGSIWQPWELPRHLCHFTPATVRALLEQSGFRVALLDHVSSPANMVSNLAYYLDARLGILHWRQPRPLRWLEQAIALCATPLLDRLGVGDGIVVHACPES